MHICCNKPNMKNRTVIRIQWGMIGTLLAMVIVLLVMCAIKVNAEEKALDAFALASEELCVANEEICDMQSRLVDAGELIEAQEQENAAISAELNQTKNELFAKTEEVESLTNDMVSLESEMFKAQGAGMAITTNDVALIAKTVWGEARGLNDFEKSMVVWCILNRVDAGCGTIAQVVTAPNQFHGYAPTNPIDEDIVALVKDVLARWQLEKVCSGNVGRTLPPDYLWFRAYQGHNKFRNKYDGDYNVWDMNCWNPYA